MNTLVLMLSLVLAAPALAITQPPPPPPDEDAQPPGPPPTSQPPPPPPPAPPAPPNDSPLLDPNSVAFVFVFYPRFGWRWVLAPWVFGLGPRPYFVHGPVRFAWYAPPWFRVHPLVRRRVLRPHRH